MAFNHSTHFRSTAELTLKLHTMATTLYQQISDYIKVLDKDKCSADKSALINKLFPVHNTVCIYMEYAIVLGSCMAVLGKMLNIENPFTSFMDRHILSDVLSYLPKGTPKSSLLNLVAQDPENPLAGSAQAFLNEYTAMRNSDLIEEIQAVASVFPNRSGYR